MSAFTRRLPIIVSLAAGIWAAHTGLGASQSQANSSTADHALGVWRLNVARSTYIPGPPPKAQTRTYEKHKFGVRATVRTTHADGHITVVQSVYDYDNIEHPVTGSEDVSALVMKRIDPWTAEATLWHADAQIGVMRREILRDGKRMTVTLKRTVPPANNTEVYDREEPEP